MKRIVCIALSIGLLAGCASLSNTAKIYRENWAASYNHGELMFFNGHKDMRLVVHGVSGGGSRPEYVAALREAMIGSHPGLTINFTETPKGEGAEAPTRIVVQADAAIAVTARTVCQSSGPVATQRPGNAPELLFAYCKRDRELSSLRLQLAAGSRPGDAAFDDAVGLATHRLLPLMDPLNKSQGCLSDC